jgi:peptidoglycan hydrolase CwlO-like protein
LGNSIKEVQDRITEVENKIDEIVDYVNAMGAEVERLATAVAQPKKETTKKSRTLKEQ